MDQQEQVQWDDVNKLLQRHGFKPVRFADPRENKNLPDLLLLDKESAGAVRATLRTMLTDSERRQALIQELVKSNNQLKEEAHEHMGQAAQRSRRVAELEGLLDAVKTRVQDLEDRCLGEAVQRHGHTQRLNQDKQEAQELCQSLEQKLSEQREEVAQLQRKLHFTIKEEERRLARQSRVFQNVCNRVSQQDSPADQQVLDVIDFYETKMTQLLDELRSVKGRPERFPVAPQTRLKKAASNVTPSFKTILKALQERQKESSSQIEELKTEVERLKQELETRLTLKEVKFYKHKLHKHYNTKLLQDDKGTEVTEDARDYRHLLSEISATVTGPGAPLRLHRQNPSSTGPERADFRTLLPTLEVWAQQLLLLKDLQKSLNKLTARLIPWQPSGGDHGVADEVKVEDMMLLVDTVLENTSTDDEKVLRSPTRHTLGSMVSHFQKLFDVAALSGVYPRMNEVYTRLGEATNAMRNLRDVLRLDSRASPAEVVNHVAGLVSATERTAGFHHLLGVADIDSIIVKVKQHEEFFPAFHALILDILQILGVSQLNHILPALKSLKKTAR